MRSSGSFISHSNLFRVPWGIGTAVSFSLCLDCSASHFALSNPPQLTGKHSFKYSGLANRGSNVGVTEKDGAVTIMLGAKKNGIKSQRTPVKKNARRAAHAAGAVAARVRPDLVKAAKAKASALARGIRSRKANA